MKLKVLIKKMLCVLPGVNILFFKYHTYRNDLDEKTLRGKIQLMGHRVDLHIMENRTFPKLLLAEFSFLIKRAIKLRLEVDTSMAWAYKMFYLAKYKLVEVDTAGKTMSNKYISDDCKCLENIIRGRRSVRKWTDDKVCVDDLLQVIDVAKWAPSSCNRQTWQVLMIDNKKDIEFLGSFFGQEFWKKAPMLAIVFVNTGVYGQNERHYAYLDGAAFIQNMLLMLDVAGYGACWMGFSRWDAAGNLFDDKDNYEKFYQYFNLQKQLVPISMIPIGKYVGSVVSPPRQDLSNIIIKK